MKQEAVFAVFRHWELQRTLSRPVLACVSRPVLAHVTLETKRERASEGSPCPPPARQGVSAA